MTMAIAVAVALTAGSRGLTTALEKYQVIIVSKVSILPASLLWSPYLA